MQAGWDFFQEYVHNDSGTYNVSWGGGVPVNGYTVTTMSGNDITGRDIGVSRRSITVTSDDSGGPPIVTIRDATTNAVKSSFNAYDPRFTGGVRVAVGYVNGDTIPDIITGAGPGGGPHLRIFDGATGLVIREFMAYETTFTGGIYVATGDVNGDGFDDIITGTGVGGGPLVKVFSGANGQLLQSFYAYGAAFRGVPAVAQYLADRGARLDAKDMRGWTALAIANGLSYSDFFKEQVKVADLLRQLMTMRRSSPAPTRLFCSARSRMMPHSEAASSSRWAT